MIYSNACTYAIRAMSRLASISPDGYVLLDELSDGDGLPRHFLAKIFQDLVRQGLLVSAKGRGGGFALARKPDKISLLDIVEAVDGSNHLEACVVGIQPCSDTQPCPLHDEWEKIRDQLRTHLSEMNLSTMGKNVQRKLEALSELASTAECPQPVVPNSAKSPTAKDGGAGGAG